MLFLPTGGGAGIIYAFIFLAVAFGIYKVFVSIATGSYKSAYGDKEKTMQCNTEKIWVKHKHMEERIKFKPYWEGKPGEKGSRYITWYYSPGGIKELEEVKAIDEKYAMPGSEAYKKIQEKKSKYPDLW